MGVNKKMKIIVNTKKEENIKTIGEHDCSAGFNTLKSAIDFINTHGEPNEIYQIHITIDNTEEYIIADDLSFKRKMKLELKSTDDKILTLTGNVTIDDAIEVDFFNIRIEHLNVSESRIHDHEFVPLIHVKKSVQGDSESSTTTTTTSTPTSTPTSSPALIFDRSVTPHLQDQTVPLSITPPLDIPQETALIYVKTDGNDINDGLTPEKSKRTIQNAINIAPSKGMIIVGSGSYDENIIIDKHLNLQGEDVFLNGRQEGSCITCTQGIISITGFTILNGKNENGGGIYNDANLTLNDCKITFNKAELGAGIYNTGNFNLFNSIIIYNTASHHGGGIYTNSPVKVIRSRIIGNTAIGDGGGIYEADGKIIIATTQINTNNSCRGGGIYSKSALNISDSEINSNTAQDNGGGIYNSAELEINGLIFRHNGTGKEGSGGAIYNTGSIKIGRETIFMLNTCGLNGGAIVNETDSSINMLNTIFTSNQGFNGGAIYNNGCIMLTESSYIGNTARNFGGAIFITKNGILAFNPRGRYTIPFDNNFAHHKGGAIYTQNKIELKKIEKGKNYPEFMVKE